MKIRIHYIFRDLLCTLTICLLTCLNAYAMAAEYAFDGQFFSISDDIRGSVVTTRHCEGKININALGINAETIDPTAVAVAPDEQHFIFRGGAGRQSQPTWFVVDIPACKVVRTIEMSRSNYRVFDVNFAFRPDSSKFYASWGGRLKGQRGESEWLTIEYSGKNYADERKLRNVFIPPTIVGTAGEKRNEYKFTADGTYLVITPFRRDWYLSVFDVVNDSEVFTIKDRDKFFGEKKKFKYLIPPDIADGSLLFTFDAVGGSEMVLFDYRERKIKNKVEVLAKGVGSFSIHGDKLIFSSIVSAQSFKKDIYIFDAKTSKKLGRATVEEASLVIDIAPDNKKLILEQKGERKTIDLVQ